MEQKKQDIIQQLTPLNEINSLFSRVKKFTGYCNKINLITGLLQFVGLSFCLWILLWAYDRYFQPSELVRKVLIATDLAILTGFLAYWIIRFFFYPVSTLRAAKIIEEFYPQEGRLSCAVEYHPMLSEEGFYTRFNSIKPADAISDFKEVENISFIDNGLPFRGSRSIMALAAADAVVFNRTKDFNKAFDKTLYIRSIFFTALVAIFLFLLIAIFPESAHYSIERYLFSDAGNSRLLRTAYKVEPGNSEILRGNDFKIKVKTAGASAYRPELVFYSVNQIDDVNKKPEFQSKRVMKRIRISDFGPSRTFEYIFKNVSSSFYYAMEDENNRYATYFVRVLNRPEISDINVRYIYPDYTELKTDMFDRNTGNVTVLAGSTVWVEMGFSKKVLKVEPIFKKSVEFRLTRNSDTDAAVQFKVVSDNSYILSLYDGQGLYNEPKPEFRIKCINDKKPVVSIMSPGKDMDLPEDYTLMLKLRCQDDFGISEIAIMTSMRGQEYKPSLKRKISGASTEIFINELLDFSSDPLGPDDVVMYYAQALDNDNINGPNIGKSKIYSLRVPSVFELFEDIENEQEYQEDTLEKILEEQKDLSQQTKKLAEKVEKTREFKWEDKKKLSEISKREKQLKAEMKKIQQNIKESLESMKQNSLISPEVLEKMNKMQQLFNELMDEDMKKLLNELQKSQQKMNITEQDKRLFQASKNQKDFEKKIERTLELLKKVKAQQKMDAMAKKAEELLKSQKDLDEKREELTQKSKNADSQEQKSINDKLQNIARKQERLRHETSRLKKEAKRSAEEFNKDYKMAAQELNKALSKLEEHQVEQNMSQASKKLSTDQSPLSSAEAGKRMKKAAQGLKQAGESLKKAASSMKSSNKSAIMKKLDDIISLAMLWSKRQSQLTPPIFRLRETGASSRETLAWISEEELDLLKTASKARGFINELGQMTFMMNPSIPGSAARAHAKTLLIKENLGIGRWTVAVAAADDLLTALTKLTKDLIDLQQNVSASSGGMGFDQFMQKMKDMLKKQQQLGKKMDMFSQRQGGTPLMRKMQSQAMKQMAMEQQMIRESMEKLSEKMSHNSALSKQMKALASEMSQIEKELKRGSVSKRARERQKRLVERMLDTTKSMNQKKKSKQRKGKTSNFSGSALAGESLSDDAFKKSAKKIRPLDYKADEKAPAEYENLIQEYFKALSESGAVIEE